MILDENPFNIREEINHSIDLTKTHISENAVNLVCIIDDNVPETIIGDNFRLRQVLTNLLNHSLKNTLTGEIRLKCSVISSKNNVLILGFELQDTGISFDKATLKKIFGDFINIDSKAVKNNDNSGFGTILSKQLIELMGGELTAVSPSGLPGNLGTKVTFTILTYSCDKPIKDLSLEKITSFDKIRALVITGTQNRDDEILGALHKQGLGIAVTTFMKTTLNQVRINLSNPDKKYNLVIIFDNEEFDGFDAVSVFWENNLTSNFIIIFISSNDKKGNYLKCITMGVDHYIVKPFDINELFNTIKESFLFIEDSISSLDIGTVRKDISILIIDDNKMNQNVLGAMLRNLGYSFEIADDGSSGFQQTKIKKYDIIFLDLIMPDMDGYETAQKILEYDKTLLIIAFSADNMPDSRRKAELSGIKDFISKPVRMEDLKKLFTKYFKK
jgi:CheY-like chemotaxis protein